MNESRFEEIETRAAFQEDLLQKLDEALSSQQKQILDLKDQLKVLGDQVRSLEAGLPPIEDAPPPHY
jgi:SlyX protein